jgi:hypothetical protein
MCSYTFGANPPKMIKQLCMSCRTGWYTNSRGVHNELRLAAQARALSPSVPAGESHNLACVLSPAWTAQSARLSLGTSVAAIMGSAHRTTSSGWIYALVGSDLFWRAHVARTLRMSDAAPMSSEIRRRRNRGVHRIRWVGHQVVFTSVICSRDTRPFLTQRFPSLNLLKLIVHSGCPLYAVNVTKVSPFDSPTDNSGMRPVKSADTTVAPSRPLARTGQRLRGLPLPPRIDLGRSTLQLKPAYTAISPTGLLPAVPSRRRLGVSSPSSR